MNGGTSPAAAAARTTTAAAATAPGTTPSLHATHITAVSVVSAGIGNGNNNGDAVSNSVHRCLKRSTCLSCCNNIGNSTGQSPLLESNSECVTGCLRMGCVQAATSVVPLLQANVLFYCHMPCYQCQQRQQQQQQQPRGAERPDGSSSNSSKHTCRCSLQQVLSFFTSTSSSTHITAQQHQVPLPLAAPQAPAAPRTAVPGTAGVHCPSQAPPTGPCVLCLLQCPEHLQRKVFKPTTQSTDELSRRHPAACPVGHSARPSA